MTTMIGKENIMEATMADTNLKLGIYCEDENYNLYGPFKTMKEAEAYNYSYIWELKKIADKDSKINKIVVDFESNTLTIDGNKNCSIKILDKTIGNGVHCFLPESWELILSKAYEACANVETIGTPPVEGEYINEVLYLRNGNE